MNNNDYNNNEEIVDVPYYTRDLCKDNKFRLARRIIKSDNIIRYRRIISEVNCEKSFFQTRALKATERNAIRVIK